MEEKKEKVKEWKKERMIATKTKQKKEEEREEVRKGIEERGEIVWEGMKQRIE